MYKSVSVYVAAVVVEFVVNLYLPHEHTISIIKINFYLLNILFSKDKQLTFCCLVVEEIWATGRLGCCREVV